MTLGRRDEDYVSEPNLNFDAATRILTHAAKVFGALVSDFIRLAKYFN
jgi:hypothetical protein